MNSLSIKIAALATVLFLASTSFVLVGVESIHDSGTEIKLASGETHLGDEDGLIAPTPAIKALSAQINGKALSFAFQGIGNYEGVREDRMIIIDFSLPSTQERFFLINPKTGEIIHKKLVAHGQNSGELYANSFSNRSGSHQSSLGFYRTAETYFGKHGYSLRLDGLQYGVNHKARNRAIVIHQADYVSTKFIAEHGRLGRSWGCPALPAEDYKDIIDEIKGGTLVFIYHPSMKN